MPAVSLPRQRGGGMERCFTGDPVSAFGGILITNTTVNKEVAEEINKIFFEVIIAPAYDRCSWKY